jgi:hypothetical protein
LGLGCEQFEDGLVAVVEDAVDRAADEEGVGQRTEWAEWDFVFDLVVHLGAVGDFVKVVTVMPAAVGAGELDVGEGGRWVEGFDEGAPVEVDAEEGSW